MPPLSSHSRLISGPLTGHEQKQAWPCGECSELLDTVVNTQDQVKEVHELDFQKDWSQQGNYDNLRHSRGTSPDEMQSGTLLQDGDNGFRQRGLVPLATTYRYFTSP